MRIIPIIVVILMLVACSSEEAVYQTITPEDAYERLQNEEILLLDVRTEMEYQEGAIPDSVLLPYDEIKDGIEALAPEKDITIFVYCRSGRRSEIAAKSLVDLGYTDVYDLGGLIDWPYDIY